MLYTRADVQTFWSDVRQRWTERKWFRMPVLRMPLYLLRDAQLSLLFLLFLVRPHAQQHQQAD
jgi:hypothetical protein